MATDLYIPDPHATYGVSNKRFEKLGKLILDRKPDNIICAGDWAEMESLSSYDKGKKVFEGKRYVHDIEAAVEAQELTFGPLNAYNAQKRKNKEKQYLPRKVMCLGNHDEGRTNKVLQLSPEYEGLISMDLLRYQDFWDDVVPFMKNITVNGILYSHYFPSGVMGNPFGSARAMLNKLHMSCIAGHMHLLDIARQTRGDGKKLTAVIGGCFFEHTPYYASGTAHLWDRGLIMLNNVNDGEFDLEWISFDQLNGDY